MVITLDQIIPGFLNAEPKEEDGKMVIEGQIPECEFLNPVEQILLNHSQRTQKLLAKYWADTSYIALKEGDLSISYVKMIGVGKQTITITIETSEKTARDLFSKDDSNKRDIVFSLHFHSTYDDKDTFVLYLINMNGGPFYFNFASSKTIGEEEFMQMMLDCNSNPNIQVFIDEMNEILGNLNS